ncbi:hypothetical protein D3C72_2422030 [compost metagenome]
MLQQLKHPRHGFQVARHLAGDVSAVLFPDHIEHGGARDNQHDDGQQGQQNPDSEIFVRDMHEEASADRCG